MPVLVETHGTEARNTSKTSYLAYKRCQEAIVVDWSIDSSIGTKTTLLPCYKVENGETAPKHNLNFWPLKQCWNRSNHWMLSKACPFESSSENCYGMKGQIWITSSLEPLSTNGARSRQRGHKDIPNKIWTYLPWSGNWMLLLLQWTIEACIESVI